MPYRQISQLLASVSCGNRPYNYVEFDDLHLMLVDLFYVWIHYEALIFKTLQAGDLVDNKKFLKLFCFELS